MMSHYSFFGARRMVLWPFKATKFGPSPLAPNHPIAVSTTKQLHRRVSGFCLWQWPLCTAASSVWLDPGAWTLDPAIGPSREVLGSVTRSSKPCWIMKGVRTCGGKGAPPSWEHQLNVLKILKLRNASSIFQPAKHQAVLHLVLINIGKSQNNIWILA